MGLTVEAGPEDPASFAKIVIALRVCVCVGYTCSVYVRCMCCCVLQRSRVD